MHLRARHCVVINTKHSEGKLCPVEVDSCLVNDNSIFILQLLDSRYSADLDGKGMRLRVQTIL